MKNTIASRIADFLKNYPPFNLLKKEDLLMISQQVKVKYLEKDKKIDQVAIEGTQNVISSISKRYLFLFTILWRRSLFRW